MSKLVFGIVMLAMLIAFSTPAMGIMDDVKTRDITDFGHSNGTITNGSVIALEGGAGHAPWTINLPSGDVQLAYVHWHTWGTDNPTANFTNGDNILETVHIIDNEFDDNVSGAWASGADPNNGTHHYYWKVNATSGVNTLDIISGDIYNKWFVVVINETDEGNRTHQGHWCHNFGLWAPAFGVNYSTWFYNASSDPINTDATYTLWTVQSHMDTFSMYFNDQFVDNRTAGGYTPTLEEFNVDNIDGDGSQKATWKDVVDTSMQYMYVYSATLAEAIPLGEPKLDPIDIVVPLVMRPNTGYTISATIKNTGDAASGTDTATLYVDGVVNGTATIPALDPEDSTTVSFNPDVNLPEGCYEFKVVVVSCNNMLVESCYVGYNIVVGNNSDFADLANDLGMPANSVTYDGGTDTYYIQDLTITNCAGDGISIEGTTKNFVINNCTVYNCTGGSSGVFLNNVTNGTITGCTLYDNKDYGIELGLMPLDSEDPKFINITCNTIYQNGISTNKNGIDLIGFDCIVKGNTIRDNGEYGIYVFGNDSKIYNNTIESNDNYGIKLYNSSGNYVYWNDLIDNNGTGKQGYDGWSGPGSALNTWNTPTEVNYPYKGSNVGYNYTGNYWNNHRDASDPDGIMDSPYLLDGGSAQDSYPLSVEWKLCGDVNRDGYPKVSDVVLLRGKVFQGTDLCNGWAGDVNCDGFPSVSDVVLLRGKVFQGTALNCCCCKGC